MGNKLSSAIADKFSNKKREDKRGEKRKRRDSDREDGEGRETPPPSSSKGLAPHSDIHTPKRKKLLSTTKYIYQTLFLDGENSDIKIYALGQEWKLHKVYLSQSPFFACMFNGSWREALQTEIDLDIPDPAIDIKSLRTAFGSLYRDYVFIKPIDVVGVFAAASLLQLEGLIQQCLTMMSNSISADTVCSYYDASLRYDIDSVKMECYNWLLTNLLIVPDVELLKQISIPLMKNLVSASELFVMQVEMDIYSLLKKWMFLQMKKSWTGSDKDLLEDVETYYKTATSECVFLESSEGRQFIPAFQGLRWQHIVTDLTSLKVLEKDKIIKIEISLSFLLGNKGAHMYNGNIFKCDACGKSYKRRCDFQKHSCNICVICQKNFASRQKLENHNCKLKEKVTCKKCLKVFQNETKCANHKCSYCYKCDKIYSSFQKLRQHKCKIQINSVNRYCQQSINSTISLTLDSAKTKTTDSVKTKTTDSAKTKTTDSAKTKTTDSVKTKALDSAKTKTTDFVKRVTTVSAKTKTTDSVKTITTDSAKTKTTDSVKTKTPYSAKTKTPDSAKTKTPDSAKTNSTDSLKTKTTDSVKTKTTDSVKTVTTDSVKTRTPDSAKTKTTDSVKTKTPDSAKTKTTDSVKTVTTDSVKRVTTASAKTKTTDSVNTITTDSVKSKAPDFVETKTQDSVKTITSDSTCSVMKMTSNSGENMTFDSVWNVAPDFVFTFQPVTNFWQTQKSKDFNLPLEKLLVSRSEEILRVCPLCPPSSLKTIGKDGNCFFRCISYYITGSEDHHFIIRRKLVSHMLANQNVMKTLMPQDRTLQNYIYSSRMGCDGTWATDTEIHAMAHMLQTNIYTYSLHGTSWKWLKFSTMPMKISDNNESGEALYIQNTNLNHFDVVISVHSTTNTDRLEEKKSFEQLDRYFIFQDELMKKQKNVTDASKRRKDYLLNYKRKQRENKTFKDMEAMRAKHHRQGQNKPEKKKATDRIYHQKARANPEFRQIEREKEKQYRREARENIEVRKKERVMDRQYHSEARKSEEIRKKEREKERQYHSEARKSEEVRKKEREKERQYHSEARKSEEVRQKERKKERQYHSEARKGEEVRKKEREKERQYHSEARKSEEVRQKERKKDRQYHSEARKSEEVRQKERKKDRQYHSEARKSEEVRKKEREKERQYHSEARKSEEVRKKEREKERQYHSEARKSEEVRKKEREKERQYHSEARKNIEVRNKEREKEIKAKRRSRNKSRNQSLETVIINFREQLKRGDDFVCTCCRQTFFQHSVYLADLNFFRKKNISSTLLDKATHGIKSCSDSEWICKTCHKYIMKKELPPMCVSNGLEMHDIPEEISKWKLTSTEERCCALRVPFMRLKQLGVGKQYGIFGNTVNVPMDPNNVVQVLPRRYEETATIKLKFMRRMMYKHATVFETIRPKVVYNTTKYLIENSDLYKEEGVKLAEEWEKDIDETEERDFESEENISECTNPSEDKNDMVIDEDEDDKWNELNEEDMYGKGNQDTLLQPLDYTDDGNKALKIAPAEGSSPVSLYLDTYAEEKSFPVLFGGKKRTSNEDRNTKLTYATICKAELRSQDPRFATSVSNMFFKLKKLQMLQVRDTVTTALRKTKGTSGLTAGEVRNKENFMNMLRHDDGYAILKNLRSSPPYLQSKQKDLFAMIRQLGIPTFFATFSAAETRWNDLLGILAKKEFNKEFTEEELSRFTWMQKCELIQKHPVPCARHFQYRTHLFFHNILLTSVSPIGRVVDYYYRAEFQQRGSPHLHCVFWIKDAPQYGSCKDEDVTNFIDQYITCSSHSQVSPSFIDLQRHKHSKSCKKMGRNICRYGFPLPPMKKTLILQSLPSDTQTSDIQTYKQNFNKIQALLQDKSVLGFTYDEFLTKCNMSEDSYILAIRSSIKKKTVFLKRKPCDIRINGYNEDILSIWQANTDLQFVLDPYAVCAYIASYIMKSQRGISLLLEQAVKEVRCGNLGVKEKMRVIANKFLNHCEVSAQEAAYLLLQMPLTQSSRDVIFVNTSPPEQRVKILKPLSMLEKMSSDDTNITCNGLHERYTERPKELENICFAEFCSKYERKKRKPKDAKESAINIDNVDKPDEDIFHDTHLYLPNGDKLTVRNTAKIIRPVNFNKSNSEMFYREQIVLYTSWRDEEDLMNTSNSYEERFAALQDEILRNKKRYDRIGEALLAAQEELNEQSVMAAVDHVAPSARQSEDDAFISKSDNDVYGCDKNELHDFGIEINCGTAQNSDIMLPNRMSSEEFLTSAQKMNDSQRQFLLHILHLVKSQCPFSIFLSGGAGVGKTFVLKLIYQTLLRYFDTVPGENVDDIKVLLTAPTGKAAYNIKGSTLHSTFGIPANHSLSTYQHLDNSRLNSIRTKYSKLQVIIIDEISMVGSNMFNFIDQRLRQIYAVDKPFGGLSLLLVGDMFQLRPVMDKWIFETADNAYSVLAPNLWHDIVTFFELKTIMRQKDDAPFAETLNRLREGNSTDQDLVHIKSRIISKKDSPLDTLHLFSSNEKVDAHNKEIFQNIANRGCMEFAQDFVIGNIPNEAKQAILNIAKDLPAQKTQNLRHILQLKIGGKYMLTHNIDTSDGLTNGALCTVMDFNKKCVWVLFDDQDVGVHSRSMRRTLYTKGIHKSWAPIPMVDKQFQVGRNQDVKVIRRQYPLTPCAALTIHKSQGSSLSEAVVSFSGKRAPGPHMVYVALSRVTQLTGLHLLDFNKAHIKVDEKVKTEMTRLRTTKQICLHTDLQSLHQNRTIIACHNIRSLHRHHRDIVSDSFIQGVHVLIILESWLTQIDHTDDYQLPNFPIIIRFDSHQAQSNVNSRPHSGIVVYARNNTILKAEITRGKSHLVVLEVTNAIDTVFHIIAVYKHHSTRLAQFLDILEEALSSCLQQNSIVLLGDFNIDLLKPNKEVDTLFNFLQSRYSLTSIINKETTDYHTCIDHIYCNMDRCDGGVAETYWSDHKVTWISCEN